VRPAHANARLPAHHQPTTNRPPQAQGRLHRNLAHRITIPDQQRAASDADSDSESGSDEDEPEAAAAVAAAAAASGRTAALPYGAGRFKQAHTLSATALALSQDGSTAFTVSKDGSICKWDVETMKRVQLMR